MSGQLLGFGFGHASNVFRKTTRFGDFENFCAAMRQLSRHPIWRLDSVSCLFD